MACIKCLGAIGALLLALLLAPKIGPINYVLRRFSSIEVLHGVHLPYYSYPQTKALMNVFNLNFYTNYQVVKGVVTRNERLPSHIVNKSKTSTDAYFEHTQQMMVQNVIKECKYQPDPVPGYLYFGNKKFSKILSLLLKENPFFANFLTAGEDDGERYLQLQAFDEDAPEKDLGTFFSLFAKKIYGKYRLFNVQFNADMEITRLVYYDKEAEKTVVTLKKDWDYWASAVVYEIKLFSGAVHSTIHVLHYILTIAMEEATKHDVSLSTWASPYPKNIPMKYVQVSALLIRPEVNFFFDSLLKLFVHESSWAATSSQSLTAAIQKDLFDIFTIWGKCKTAQDFIDKFLLRDLYSSPNGKELAEKAGILKEFKKIVDNVGPYAKDLTEAMKKDGSKAFETAEIEFKKFIQDTGDANLEYEKISHFVELMSVTGIMHGSTLSYTRAAAIPEVMRWKNDYIDVWDKLTLLMCNAELGTISGAEHGRHVFMSKNPDSISRDWQTEKIAEHTIAVMREYDDKVEKIKEANKAALLKNPLMREYGWILTDWCPDSFDGKQLTITTYI